MPKTFRHVTKDDPDFLNLCKEITHISRIRKDLFGKQTYIDADRAPKSNTTRRNESVDKNRG